MTGNAGCHWQRGPHGDVIVCAPLLEVAPHAFTTRALGPGRSQSEIRHAYEVVASHLQLEAGALQDARQVHGTAVHVAERHGPAAGDADILITADAGTAVVVRTADCTPILLADRGTGAVAAIHAGWRGTCAGAVTTAVDALASRYGSRPADLVAAIGPAIGPCCYQVGTDVHDAFLSRGGAADPSPWFVRDGNRWRLDLRAASRDQLIAAGVPDGAIYVCGDCTASALDHYHSYRAEGAGAGRQFAAIRPPRR